MHISTSIFHAFIFWSNITMNKKRIFYKYLHLQAVSSNDIRTIFKHSCMMFVPFTFQLCCLLIFNYLIFRFGDNFLHQWLEILEPPATWIVKPKTMFKTIRIGPTVFESNASLQVRKSIYLLIIKFLILTSVSTPETSQKVQKLKWTRLVSKKEWINQYICKDLQKF